MRRHSGRVSGVRLRFRGRDARAIQGTYPPTPLPGALGLIATRKAAGAFRSVPYASQRRRFGLCVLRGNYSISAGSVYGSTGKTPRPG